jgi:hypothetical protein
MTGYATPWSTREPTREELTGLHARAIAVAGCRYRRGTDRYEGCKAGFLDGYPGIAPLVEHPEPRSPDWLEGYWTGWDVAQLAWRTDQRKNGEEARYA